MYLMFESLHDIAKKSFFMGWGGGLPRFGGNTQLQCIYYLVPYTELDSRGYFGV